jgi:hypothetical protein
MDFLYDDVRNLSFGLHSEKRTENGRIVYVLQLVNMRTGRVDKEQRFFNWNDYSRWYQSTLVMLQSAP